MKALIEVIKIRMKKILILAIIASIGIMFSCGGEDKKSSKPATSKPKKKKVDGAKIYKMNCVICHGADGKLGINGAKPLPESVLSNDEKIVVVKKGQGVMTPFESILTEEQITAVVEYTNSLK